VSGRTPEAAERRRSLAAVGAWVGLGLALGLWIAAARGPAAAAEYYAAYVLEKSLSVDNIFVFIVIFSELHIPPERRRRVLWFGVAGALVFRAVMVGAGVALVQRFHWAVYPFAGLILFAAWRILFGAEAERRTVEEACNVCTTWIARVVRVSPVLHGDRFWRRENGRLVATPLLVALVVIETTDIVFALDSVPAVLAVTRDPLIVYSSNVMAMLGLRSIYFVLADTLHRLRFLRHGLAVILLFTAGKLVAGDWLHIGPGLSILIIGAVLSATVAASLLVKGPESRDGRDDEPLQVGVPPPGGEKP
jgi:tellurite resistance protein TerC